jgi:hypothetical protein
LNPEPPVRRRREAGLAALVFLALTVLMTWPQALHMSDALSDFGDAKLVARILQWDVAQALRDPIRLFQLDFFHPARYVLAFSENLFGVAVFASRCWPRAARRLTQRPLPGCSCRARRLGPRRRRSAGVGRGRHHAFLPWRMEPDHQFQWGVSLSDPAVFPISEPAARDLVTSASPSLECARQRAYAIFSGFSSATPCGSLRRRGRGRIRGAVAAAAGSLPFLRLGYARAAKLYGFRRYTSELETYSGRWTDFLSAAGRNRFWGPLTERWGAPEGHFFPGALTAVLAVVAVALLWRHRVAEPESGGLRPPPPRRAAVLDARIALLAIVWSKGRAEPRWAPCNRVRRVLVL